VIEGVFRDSAPRLYLTITGETESADIEFVVDTGYTGYLALSETILRSLGAVEEGIQYLVMADGSYRRCSLYTISVAWNNEEREIQAVALDDDPLLGISLMREFQLHVEVVEGGLVALEEM
jgi:clan AA aspartic protease